MHTIFWRPLVSGLVLLALTAPAAAIELKGQRVQGGLLIGRAAPGTTVAFQGRTLRLSPDGLFVIGFDRDAPLETVLTLRTADGGETRHPVRIAARSYDIQRIGGLPQRKVTPAPEDLKRIRREAALARTARERDDPRTDFARGFIWPVHGRISGVYGSQRILNGEPRRPHYGVDIAAPAGTPVKAPADGVVSLVHPDMFFSGRTLILDHGHGVSSTFLHLSAILVREGQAVRQGEVIARVGASGRVTGSHLDWRMNWFEQRIDPTLLVPPMPAGQRP
ncbi:MAG: M23 family metallopeptidase [Desulfobacteraceae bacterium]|jgi:murein DD-endopeptidase MepM/ murein hydrolase activator NlpD|nr:M23 family metallopeptidase [Desulfobacteraceae bacterium]